MVNYRKLFYFLEKTGMSKTDLRLKADISTATLAKLSKNENVGLDVIEKICRVLKVQPGDILSIDYKTENLLLARLREECDMDLHGSLYHLTQIKLAYNSNHIEGSRLSEDETRYIFETNTIGIEKSKSATRVDDIIETVNHFDAFRYLLKIADDELSEGIIKEFHRILKTGTSDSRKSWFRVGDYKTIANVVGDKETTAPEKVGVEIKKLLLDYNSIAEKTLDDLIDFHYRFENIHPFQDGNGRVGRLILFKECLAWNIVPVLIEDKIKFFYYRGLKEYKTEKGFLRDTILTGQDYYAELMKKFEPKAA